MKAVVLFVIFIFMVVTETRNYREVERILKTSGYLRKWFTPKVLSDPKKNMVCSPMSAILPLAKIGFGASGRSYREIMTALGVGLNDDESEVYSQMIDEMRSLDGVEVTVASRIYASDTVTINSTFAAKTELVFGSSIAGIDLTDRPASAKLINDWVSSHTDGKIRDMVKESHLPSDTNSLIIVNALYFKGNWDKKFVPVRKGLFNTPTRSVYVPMMRRQALFLYTENDDLGADVISIPYRGSEASFVIFLPHDSLRRMLRKIDLDPMLCRNAMRRFKAVDLDLTMPTFTIETELDLVSLYKKLNVKTVFDSSKSTLNYVLENGDKVFVSKASQKAYIEVNEKGTTAAAAAVFDMTPLSLPSYTKVTVNRPFLFMIVTSAGEQLFSGIYSASETRK